MVCAQLYQQPNYSEPDLFTPLKTPAIQARELTYREVGNPGVRPMKPKQKGKFFAGSRLPRTVPGPHQRALGSAARLQRPCASRISPGIVRPGGPDAVALSSFMTFCLVTERDLVITIQLPFAPHGNSQQAGALS